jgi:hypothetical protein
MTDKTNKYPGTCTHCKGDVPAGEGVIYKTRPYTDRQPWKVRCADEGVCVARVTDAKRVAEDQHHEKWLAGETHQSNIKLVERYPNLPKTVRIDVGGHRHTLSLRNNPSGTVTLRHVEERGDERGVDNRQYRTEIDARAGVIRFLWDTRAPYFGRIEFKAEAEQVLAAGKAG